MNKFKNFKKVDHVIRFSRWKRAGVTIGNKRVAARIPVERVIP